MRIPPIIQYKKICVLQTILKILIDMQNDTIFSITINIRPNASSITKS